jgi:hypothetical protein
VYPILAVPDIVKSDPKTDKDAERAPLAMLPLLTAPSTIGLPCTSRSLIVTPSKLNTDE